MEIKILNEDSKNIEFELKGEGHTISNLLRNELWKNKDINLAAYRLEHPLISSPVISVSSSGKPRKAILKTVDDIKKNIKSLRNEFKKIR